MSSPQSIQEVADQRLPALSLPTSKREDWRYVDCSVLEQDFPAAPQGSNSEPIAFLSKLPQLILDNGDCVQENLADGWQRSDAGAPLHWLQDMANSDSPYLLACASSTSKELNLKVSGSAAQKQVLVLRSSGGLSTLRINIDCAAGSLADLIIVHDHAADARCQYAIHVNAAADSVLRVDELELNSSDAQVLHHRFCSLAKSAQVNWQQMGFAGGLQRHYWQADINDADANCRFGSACMNNASYQAHHVIKVAHHSPHCFSQQLFKSIGMDQSRYSFNGLVRMDKGADECSADQQNANLQLSAKARVHSRPQLDIHTDDVIATHGSATGQVDPNELYYLRTRGLEREEAEQLIVGGFLQEVTGQFHSDACKSKAAALITRELQRTQ